MNEQTQERVIDDLTDAEVVPLIHRDALVISRAFERVYPALLNVIQDASDHLHKHLKELDASAGLTPDEKLAVECATASSAELLSVIRSAISVIKVLSAGIECENLMRSAEVLYRTSHENLGLSIEQDLEKFLAENQPARNEADSYRKTMKVFPVEIVDSLGSIDFAIGKYYQDTVDSLLETSRKKNTGANNDSQAGKSTVH